MFPKSLSELFNGALHIIFGVVAAQGFLVGAKTFMPIRDLFSYEGLLSGYGLFFTYFFLVTSWLGYHKSVSEYPHLENRLGLLRFAGGILITFLLYYMITLTDEDNRNNYNDIYWILVIIFAVLIFTHTIKYHEYKTGLKGNDKKSLTTIIYLTLLFFGIFVLHACIHFFVNSTHTPLVLNGINVWDVVFTTSAFILVFVYRLKTWGLYGPKKVSRRKNTTGKPRVSGRGKKKTNGDTV